MVPSAKPPTLAATAAAKAAAAASGVPVEAVRSASIGPSLRIDLFRLGNGLKIVLAVDPRAPIFAYQTWFQVGSRDEDPQRTGLAHLFEHLMFKGTKTRPSGTFDAEMERRGAQTNAATWVDWTYYTQALASRGDNLETLVGFEADRMHNLVLDQATFQSELEVVKNERRMSVDNAVQGLLSEALFGLVFQTHPYRWPTIGSMAHLEAASLAELESFYRSHYAPNRATVVICGDVDTTVALEVLARGYGPLPAAPARPRHYPAEPPQRSPRAALVVRPVLAPQIALGFRAPAQGSRQHAGLEMLLTLLTDGDTALLYDALVTEKKMASEVSGFLTPFADPGLCELHIVAIAGGSVDDILHQTRRVLLELPEHISEESVHKACNGLRFAYYDGLRDVDSVAEAIGHHETNAGDFMRAFGLPDLYASFSAQELSELAREIFAPEQENVVVAVSERAQAGESAAKAAP